jgi:hypothetical protein
LSSPAVPSPHPDPAKSNSVNFSESGIMEVANAGIKIYNLINVLEFYNEEKKEKKKRAL